MNIILVDGDLIIKKLHKQKALQARFEVYNQLLEILDLLYNSSNNTRERINILGTMIKITEVLIFIQADIDTLEQEIRAILP